MIIYPAIDIKQGKCVRLVQGDFKQVTVYSDNPINIAKKWEGLGAEYVHIVDLDGAVSGKLVNYKIIKKIASSINIPIQLGGGIRSMDNIEDLLGLGVNRLILGTAAMKNQSLVEEAIRKYKDKIVIGIDAKDGQVATEGWEEISEITAINLGKKVEAMGAQTIIYTDIGRDGMLIGPNISAMQEMATKVNVSIIASGGISKTKDIEDLKETPVEGVIIGKALYTEDVNLKEAIEMAKRIK